MACTFFHCSIFFFFLARFYMTIMEATNVKDSKLTGTDGTNCLQLTLKNQYAPQDSDPKWFELRMPSGNRWERKQTKTTSTKAVERSSEKICYTKHKSESRISRLLLLLSAQKKKLNTFSLWKVYWKRHETSFPFMELSSKNDGYGWLS